MSKIERCKNCKNWTAETKKYGRCSILGKPFKLNFAYENGTVYPLTPRYGVCEKHSFKNQ